MTNEKWINHIYPPTTQEEVSQIVSLWEALRGVFSRIRRRTMYYCINRRKKESYKDSTHTTHKLSLSHRHTHTRTHTKPHSQTDRKETPETRKGPDQGPQKPLPNRHPELGSGTALSHCGEFH